MCIYSKCFKGEVSILYFFSFYGEVRFPLQEIISIAFPIKLIPHSYLQSNHLENIYVTSVHNWVYLLFLIICIKQYTVQWFTPSQQKLYFIPFCVTCISYKYIFILHLLSKRNCDWKPMDVKRGFFCGEFINWLACPYKQKLLRALFLEISDDQL